MGRRQPTRSSFLIKLDFREVYMKYSVAKQNAKEFAKERKASVWISKENSKVDYKIEFTPTTTENYTICEEVPYELN